MPLLPGVLLFGVNNATKSWSCWIPNATSFGVSSPVVCEQSPWLLSMLVMAASQLFLGDEIPLSSPCSTSQVSTNRGARGGPRSAQAPQDPPGTPKALGTPVCPPQGCSHVSFLTTWHCPQCHTFTLQLSIYVSSPQSAGNCPSHHLWCSQWRWGLSFPCGFLLEQILDRIILLMSP